MGVLSLIRYYLSNSTVSIGDLRCSVQLSKLDISYFVSSIEISSNLVENHAVCSDFSSSYPEFYNALLLKSSSLIKF